MVDRVPSITRDVAVSARAMRRAIDDTPERHLGGLLDGFPRHCCKPGSQLLARYLVTIARVPMVQFVSARRYGAPYCDGGWQSHVWLEACGMVVDITADQYVEVTPASIVSQTSDWHDTFQVQSRVPYGQMMQMNAKQSRRFDRTFRKLVDSMEAPQPPPRRHRSEAVTRALNSGTGRLRSAASVLPARVVALGAALRSLGVLIIPGD